MLVERVHVARLDIDDTQDTTSLDVNKKLLLTSSNMYSAIVNVVMRLFHGIVGSSNWFSRFYTFNKEFNR